MKNKLFSFLAFALLCVGVSAQVVLPADGNVYRLVNVKTGKAITNGNTSAHNTYLSEAMVDANSKGQEWCFVSLSDKQPLYALYNINYGQAVDMTSEPGKLLQWECTCSDNQAFYVKMVNEAEGIAQLLCKNDQSLVLQVQNDGSLHMKKDVSGESTHFKLQYVKNEKIDYLPVIGRYFIIREKNSGNALNTRGSSDNNARIWLDEYNENEQKFFVWQLRRTAQGEEYCQLYAPYLSKAVDAALKGAKTPLLWDPSYSNENQMFRVIPVEGQPGVYLINVKTGGSWHSMQVDGDAVYMGDGYEGAHFTIEAVELSDVPMSNVWEDETFFGENKEEGHATYMPYASVDKMMFDARYEKPWLDPEKAEYLSLNGTWKLNWVESVDKRPGQKNFYGDDVDVSAWNDISVPSCLEMNGYGDPLYINVEYAFNNNPPLIQMKEGLLNSVASYRRNFDIPAAWGEKNVFLHFDGIYGAAFVWVNGSYVGYTQSGNNDAEFDITQYLRQTNNNVSVQVVRWSDASYLEGQDMWHMSGIHRDVYLFATPKAFVRDHYITSNLDADAGYTSGRMNVELSMDNRSELAVEKTVEVSLMAPDGTKLESKELNFSFVAGEKAKKGNLIFENLANLKLWTAETPYLYTVVVAQKDAEGNAEHVFSTKYGFRDIAIKDGLVYINGEKVLFKGANLQDTHPVTGRSVDVATMLNDVKMMKQANMNTVRTSHYPRQAKMNAMFDYYGLYCMDEADLECHYSWDKAGENGGITNEESWKEQYVDRTVRMVYRDRNFPSIIFWSLGNESGGGNNFKYTYEATRALDPRPIHYEGASRAGTAHTDIYSEMYPLLSEVEMHANGTTDTSYPYYGNTSGQPYFMCEYAHAMGNAVGNLQEYWDKIENSRYGIGGCIWDWADQSIYDSQDIAAGNWEVDGMKKYRSGFDYPGPHQGNFVNNGLVTADRAWSPELTNVKHVYQYVKFLSYNAVKHQLKIKNDYDFISLDKFYLKYTLLVDGEVVETGNVDMPAIAPGESKLLDVPYRTEIAADGKEALMNFELCYKDEQSWVAKDYVIANKQYTLVNHNSADVAVNGAGELTLVKESNTRVVRSSNMEMEFANDGTMLSWVVNGHKLMEVGPEYGNYRWVENDKPTETLQQYAVGPGIKSKSATFNLSEDGQQAIVEVNASTWCSDYKFVYTITADGAMLIDASYTATVGDARRIGMTMEFPANFEHVEYYAYGPFENYVDRRGGSMLGRYNTTVSDMFEPYPKPQSMGNREGLRELSLYDAGSGVGVKVQAKGDVAFSLLHYSDEQLKNASHTWELEKGNVYAHFDCYQKGIGNGSCGNVATLDKYLIPNGAKYNCSLLFTPIVVIGGTSVDAVVNDVMHFAVADGVLVCEGELEYGASVAVYNMGGVMLSAATATTNKVELSVAGAPRGSYVVVVKNGNKQKVYKILL